MIKLTNREMLEFMNCSIFTKSLPAKMSFFFAMAKKKMEDPIKIFNEERNKLVEKYCERDLEGNPVSTSDGGIRIQKMFADIVGSEIDDLLNIEVELNLEKFTMYLDKIDELEIDITADDMLRLIPIVDFKETNTSGAPG